MERVVEATRVDDTGLKRADDAESQNIDPNAMSDAMTDAAEESMDSSW
jgi:hypothetical protein